MTKKENKAEYHKKYREINREKHRLNAIEYRKNHSAEINARRRKNDAENIDEVRAKQRKYYDNNRERIINYSKKRNARIRRDDPMARCLHSMRSRIAIAVKDQGTTKLETSMRLFGCSTDELRSHLEGSFTDGMTWDNYGINGWHVDHVRPCSSFDLTLDSAQKECFHYTNLQPLWAEDNLRKSNKYEAR